MFPSFRYRILRILRVSSSFCAKEVSKTSWLKMESHGKLGVLQLRWLCQVAAFGVRQGWWGFPFCFLKLQNEVFPLESPKATKVTEVWLSPNLFCILRLSVCMAENLAILFGWLKGSTCRSLICLCHSSQVLDGVYSIDWSIVHCHRVVLNPSNMFKSFSHRVVLHPT